MDRDYAYNVPDEFRPKVGLDLIKVASRPYMGITAHVAGRPRLVIGFDGRDYTLEDTEGETIQLASFLWDDDNTSEENALVAASRVEGSPLEAGMEIDGLVIGKLSYDDESGEWSVEADNGETVDLVTLIEQLEAQGWQIDETVDLDIDGPVRHTLEHTKAAFFSCEECADEDCDENFCGCECHDEEVEEAEAEGDTKEAVADESDYGKKPVKCPKCGSHTCGLMKANPDGKSKFRCKNCGDQFSHDVTVVGAFADEHLPEEHAEEPVAERAPIEDAPFQSPSAPGDPVPEFNEQGEGSNLGFISDGGEGDGIAIQEITEDFGDSKIVRADDGREYMVTPDGAVSFHGHRIGEVTDPRLLFGQKGPDTDVLDPADGPTPDEQRNVDREIEQDDADDEQAPAHPRKSSFDKTTDTDGAPLREGWFYAMHSPKYRIPDHIHVVQITPDLLVATTHEGSVTLRIKASDLSSEDYSFEPLIVPNADHKIEAHFVESMPKTAFDPMSLGPNEIMAALHSMGWAVDQVGHVVDQTGKIISQSINGVAQFLVDHGVIGVGHVPIDNPIDVGHATLPNPLGKEARRKFTPSQQRAFIEEEGKARNSDKLNLDGTHYGQDEGGAEDELDVFFLW